MEKSALSHFLVGLVAVASLTSCSGQLGISGASEDQKIEEMLEQYDVIKVAPIYPPRAARSGTEGYATVRYNVDRTGRTKDLEVIESEPPGVFDSASLIAASKFRYRPRIVDGVALEQEGVTNTFTYAFH